MSERTCIVTGANTGIGHETALGLARRGYRVFAACRDLAKGRRAVDRIARRCPGANVESMELDLASLDSVRRAADRFLARDLPLHLLVNNAGVAGQRGKTREGFEVHFGTNHLGHFLLTRMLLDRIRSAGRARIVTVASKAHYEAKGLDFGAVRRPTATFAGLREYEVSKLANVLFSRELGRRLAGTGVTTYALHPGVVKSEAWRRIPWPVRVWVTRDMISNEDGAKTSLYCATAAEVAECSGRYYDGEHDKEPSALARDDSLAEALWETSERWTGLNRLRAAHPVQPVAQPFR